jgi:hypothetical protein
VPERFEHQSVISGVAISETGRRLDRPDIDLTIEACSRGLELRWHHGSVEGPGQGTALIDAMMACVSERWTGRRRP